ncbi:ribosome hibernation-promoting factor, HPF/YfiA family [Clostridium sp. DJ247]|uniref:ribosome hibernation-promoting factor, HPF/YfiA family n=1 Tax=Clostridium sp. DJ247 TaxID=2726188 RepID=UPI0016238A3C|nr:ribosome-associated translation inhibitor RaiA [Clostridium sp. DJ247]MBC2582240.1 ribosome-associated translation inhibitor RaiA [Clostridium sp. DJ247]
MRIIISGKNIEVTTALRNNVEKKLSKLEKYFTPEVEAHATLSVEKNRQIVEVVISVGGMLLRAEEVHDDMYASIDFVVGKLEGQIRKQKTKLERRKHMESVRFQDIPDYDNEETHEEHKIVKTKRFAMKPMSAEEAVLQMELIGHNFFVYQDADGDEVNVVYKRKDGNYGLIEPEF